MSLGVHLEGECVSPEELRLDMRVLNSWHLVSSVLE